MKVLHVLASNKYSGAENVVCQIINMFSEEEMAYCSPDGDIANTLKDKNIKFLPLKKFSLKELKRVIKKFNPDIVHAHDLKAIILVSLIKGKFKKVGHVHVNDKQKMGKLSVKSFALKLVSKKFEHIFWVSKSCLMDYKFKKQVESRSSVLYNIIDINSLLNLKNADQNNYDYDIVYLGRLTYQKNPIRILDIAEKLKEKNPNFKIAIIGSGDLEEEFKNEVASRHLEKNVITLGFMKNAYKLLSCAKALLMTSRFEGTPMVALESLSLGVPIVSTKTDGMVDLLKQNYNGFLYDTDEEAVENLLEVFNNSDKLQQMKNNCVEFSKEYNNVENYKQKIKDVYKKWKAYY